MAFLFRWLMRLVVLVVIGAIVSAGLAWYVGRRSLPEYDRTHQLAGVSESFEIIRDRHAVPHILARSDADAYFGLGFAHAQDRLWQMTLLRRTAQGRLSELFGERTVGIDTLIRSLDLHGFARGAARSQDAETTAILEAYSAGVNAWMRVVQAEALGRGAPEFFFFGAAISPWRPADSIAVQKLLALRLTDKAAREALRAQMSLHLPPERLRDLMPESHTTPVMALPEYARLFPEGTRFPAPVPVTRQALSPLSPVGMAGASNAFAAAPARAAAGAPLLASDPHLALTVPSPLYLARLDLEGGPVMGATLPGLPAVLIGRSEHLAWGLTASYLDDQDIYIEKLNPTDPGEYLTPDGYRPLETRSSTIKVADAPSQTVTLRRTRHGPVIPEGHFGVDPVTPEGHVASLAWTALTTEDRSLGASLKLMGARNIREARAALREVVSPSLMITLADRDTVALQMTGAIPRRQPGHTSQGRIPAPGWLAVNDWQGFQPFSRNPWVINPPGGIVVNTNNRLTTAAFPDHLSFDWGDSYRITRAARLLGEREYHTLESFTEIQTDAVSAAARSLLPLIARDLWYSGEAADAGTAVARRQEALELLAVWNGDMSEHKPEPLIYAAWLRALQRRLIVDELGPLVAELPMPDPVFLDRVFHNTGGASVWCDVRQTSMKEDCSEIARRALDDALDELVQRFGPRITGWRWGEAHEAVHVHETLSNARWLRPLVNIRQSTGGGDHTLQRAMMSSAGDDPYASRHAAVFRGVFDFSDPESSRYILSTGQSGNPLSRHYDDLAALWRRAEYIPMAFDPALARAGSVGVTRMVPAGGSAVSE